MLKGPSRGAELPNVRGCNNQKLKKEYTKKEFLIKLKGPNRGAKLPIFRMRRSLKSEAQNKQDRIFLKMSKRTRQGAPRSASFLLQIIGQGTVLSYLTVLFGIDQLVLLKKHSSFS